MCLVSQHICKKCVCCRVEESEVLTEFPDGCCVPSDNEQGLAALLLGLIPTHRFFLGGGGDSRLRD